MNKTRSTTSSVAAAAIFALTAAMALNAAEIAFTGGDGGKGTDLATAANWSGGALPTANDVGTVNFSTYTGGGALTLSADLALAGLQLTNMPSSVTITGTSTLSLGAGGFVAHANKTLALDVPVATTAKQVWNFWNGALTTSKTIAGTS